MSDDDLLLYGALAVGALVLLSDKRQLAGPRAPSTQPEGAPYGAGAGAYGNDTGSGQLSVEIATTGGTVQAAIPAPPLADILGGNPLDPYAGAMGATSPRLQAAFGGATAQAPSDAAGQASLERIAQARQGLVAPQPIPLMGVRKISPNGSGVVPPAPADRTSRLSLEPRRWTALRSVG